MTKRYRHILFYTTLVGGLLFVMYYIISHGERMEAAKNVLKPVEKEYAFSEVFQHFSDVLHHNITHPLSILLLQIFLILFVSRTFGYIFSRMGQPTVIGEIVAGIIIGPSLLGMYFPQYLQFLFPASSLGSLQMLSQVGLVLFMFVIGMELDFKVLKNKASDAVVISHASIVIPYALGMVLAYFMYERFAPNNIDFLSFSLFAGIAMSITAFPVLARILQERGMTRTKLGTMVITCAAADDITAWCILAAVIAIVKAGTIMSSLFTIGLVVIYVFVMIRFVQPFLKRIGEVYNSKESMSIGIISILFGTLLASSFVTEIIGIHALFGAFMAGVVMPPLANFRKLLIDKVEFVALGLLLPLFFVFTGLRTQIGLLNENHLWLACFWVILVAMVGKIGGSTFAARMMGNSWKDSWVIGALMNTRGLMELVVLNIGYDLGILSPQVFTMFVLMALATTFMTGPLLDLIEWFYREKKNPADTKSDTVVQSKKYSVLLSFGNPQSGRKMVRLAHALTSKSRRNTEITALHVSPSSDINLYEAEEFEKESFRPVRLESNKLDIHVKTIFKASNDINAEILDVVEDGAFDLLIIGIGQSIFEGTLLGKIVGFTAKALNPEKIISKLSRRERLMEGSKVLDERSLQLVMECPVSIGVFIDKDFSGCEKMIFPVYSFGDFFLFLYAKQLIKNNNSSVVLMDMGNVLTNHHEFLEEINRIREEHGDAIKVKSPEQFTNEGIAEFDLMLISFESWKKAVLAKEDWFSTMPSALIIRP